jgi:hypothetical protein
MASATVEPAKPRASIGPGLGMADGLGVWVMSSVLAKRAMGVAI